MVLATELLGLLRVGEDVLHLHFGIGADGRAEAHEGVTAFDMDIAAERTELALQPDGQRAGDLLVGDRRLGNGGWAAIGVHAGGPTDQLGVAAGDFGDALDWILLHSLDEFVEAVRLLFYEFLVVEFFLDDHVDPTKCHRRIGAGAKR